MFESALAAGVVAMGADVWLTGPLPTPGIAFITSSMRCDAGVVISASHNPFEDNGIKVFARDGYKLPDDIEAEIETLMGSPDLDAQRAAPTDVGYARKVEDARRRYVVFCKSTFPSELTLDGVRIVVDGAHGAAYRVGPAVFEELGATVIRDLHQTRWQEHQCARGCAASAGDVRDRTALRRAPRGRARRRRRSLCVVRRARGCHRRRRPDGAVRDADDDRGQAREADAQRPP